MDELAESYLDSMDNNEFELLVDDAWTDTDRYTMDQEDTNRVLKEPGADVQMDDALPFTETPLVATSQVSDLLENSLEGSVLPLFGMEEAAEALVNIGRVPDSENMPSPDSSECLLSDTCRSQSQSYPSLAMSKILSVQSAPQHPYASSQITREASAPFQTTCQLQQAPLLAMSKILVVFQTTFQCLTISSLGVPKDAVPGMPITLPIEPEDSGVTLASSTNVHGTITETIPPSVEVHDSVEAGIGEDSQKSTRDQSADAGGDTTPKHTAGPEQIAPTTRTIQPHSKHVSFSGLSARALGAYDDRSRDECSPHPRTIDFEQLVKIAAARSSRPFQKNFMNNLPDGEETPHMLQDVTSSAKDVITSYPSLENTRETRGPSPGGSTDRGRPNTQRSLPQMNLSQPGTRAKPIMIDDMSEEPIDDYHRKPDQRDTGSDLDLMQHALHRVTQRDTRNEAVRRRNDPEPGQRRSPRRSRNKVHHSGLFNWKPPVDGLLDNIEDTWTNVQCAWIELYTCSSMKKGSSGRRFQNKMCEVEKVYLETQKIGAADAHKLCKDWQFTESLVAPRLEGTDRALMRKFDKAMRRFHKVTRVLDDRDTTVGMDLEGEDEGDMDWTPSVGDMDLTPNVKRKGMQ